MKTEAKITNRKNRVICLPFTKDAYDEVLQDTSKFRGYIDEIVGKHPELFPIEIFDGYQFKDKKVSKKQNITIRRIEIDGISYTIRPSFVMPYMTDTTDVTGKVLFLRKFDVPFWALSHVFGKDPMHWHRMEQTLGRNSIVGTTIRKPEDIPKHLAADEKHTWLLKDKVYVATTVGEGCILGAEIAKDAGKESLTEAYKVFKEESQNLMPNYSPETVNIDGWSSTQSAWTHLFKSVFIVFCFLHVFIKIRDRGKKKYHDIYMKISSKLWECYRAKNKGAFSQRIRRLVEWSDKNQVPDVFQKPIKKLHTNISNYRIAYEVVSQNC